MACVTMGNPEILDIFSGASIYESWLRRGGLNPMCDEKSRHEPGGGCNKLSEHRVVQNATYCVRSVCLCEDIP